MSTLPLAPGAATPATKVLVVDDDRRVREVLEAALTTHGFGVITAADGEEALQRAQRERPDLVLLDVRLPKRSGLEVCDVLRSDPTDPSVPIILISAAVESEQRLQGFLRGADDVLPKPFSPKELVARIRRLLARSQETRAAQRRSRDLERELTSARREAQRAGEDARREQDLREIADDAGRELLRTLDLDPLGTRLLEIAQARTRATVVGLLVADRTAAALVPLAVRGDRWERVAGARLSMRGELAELLVGLARPVRLVELHRLHPSAELEPLIAGRWDRIVPIVAVGGLEGALLIEELAVAEPARGTLQGLAVLAGFAGIALSNARDVRAQAAAALAALVASVPAVAVDAADAEARHLLDRIARSNPESTFPLAALEAAWALGRLAAPPRAALESLAATDPSGLADAALRLLDAVAAPPATRSPLAARFAALLDYRASRRAGVMPVDAMTRAVASIATSDGALAERLMTEAASLEPGSRDAA